jgi:hypothetical protein
VSFCSKQQRTVQYSTVQYSTVQYSTVQYSTVQYSTVQYSTCQLKPKLGVAGVPKVAWLAGNCLGVRPNRGGVNFATEII